MNKRLTYKEPNGKFGVVGMNEDNREEKLYSCVMKLMDYEEQGLAPSEVEFLKKLYDDSVMEQDKLRAELEKTQSRFITKVGLLIEAEYEKAKKLDYVKKPLAFALYKVWKMVDKQNGDVK